MAEKNKLLGLIFMFGIPALAAALHKKKTAEAPVTLKIKDSHGNYVSPRPGT